MFGKLMRWSPGEGHRDIDDLFGRLFQRSDSENSFSNWTPRVETYRKDNDYVV
jgi:HSP20 family molecular chaperone IbpA